MSRKSPSLACFHAIQACTSTLVFHMSAYERSVMSAEQVLDGIEEVEQELERIKITAQGLGKNNTMAAAQSIAVDSVNVQMDHLRSRIMNEVIHGKTRH